MTDDRVRRRWLLATVGAAGAGVAAGCGGAPDNATEAADPTDPPSDATEGTDPAPAETGTDRGGTPADTDGEGPVPDVEPRLFTGENRVFVVNGYSTSFQWPDVLQRKLDRYFDGDRVVTVEKAVESGTPVARWMDPDTGDPKEPWRGTLVPALDQDAPVVALAQQSLQWVYGEHHEGIRGKEDEARIERGANVLERYANGLLADGAAHVFVATHIYKEPLEPVIGNERLALEALMDREPSNVTAGPDVWEPTRNHWPEAFQDDELHPNDAGAEIMAHHWFGRLLASDGRDVPPWSRSEMEEALPDGTGS